MKYMSFNSSCAYAGITNMLEQYGIDTEDRIISAEIGLPYLFSYENGAYSAGPMLQTAEWFNLYLKPRGLSMNETVVSKGEVCGFLQKAECAMVGIEVSEGNKHAVVFNGMENGQYRFINNKWEQSEEPDRLVLSEEELLRRLDDTAAVAALQKIEAGAVDIKKYFEKSVEVLARLKSDLAVFCSKERQPQELRDAMNTLFRAVLLDGITMLELIGQAELCERLRSVQREFLNVMKEGKAAVLKERIPFDVLVDVIDEYSGLIKEKIGEAAM